MLCVCIVAALRLYAVVASSPPKPSLVVPSGFVANQNNAIAAIRRRM